MDIPTHLQRFNALVQAQTTVISALSYLLGCAFTYFYYDHFNTGDAVPLFIAVICFYLAVNDHNQYTDYRRFYDSSSISENNIIAKFKISLSWTRLIILAVLFSFQQ